MPYNDLMYLLKLAHRYLCTSNWVNTLLKKSVFLLWHDQNWKIPSNSLSLVPNLQSAAESIPTTISPTIGVRGMFHQQKLKLLFGATTVVVVVIRIKRDNKLHSHWSKDGDTPGLHFSP